MAVKLKLIAKPSRRPEMKFRALLVYRKRNVSAPRQRAYSTVNRAVLGAVSWLMRDGQVNSHVMIYDPVSSQEIAQVRMGSLGNIRTVFPWGEDKQQ